MGPPRRMRSSHPIATHGIMAAHGICTAFGGDIERCGVQAEGVWVTGRRRRTCPCGRRATVLGASLSGRALAIVVFDSAVGRAGSSRFSRQLDVVVVVVGVVAVVVVVVAFAAVLGVVVVVSCAPLERPARQDAVAEDNYYSYLEGRGGGGEARGEQQEEEEAHERERERSPSPEASVWDRWTRPPMGWAPRGWCARV